MNVNVADYSLLPVLPEIVLALGAMALLMLGAYRGERTVRIVTILAIVLLAVTLVLELMLPAGRLTTFGGSFVVDDYARFLKTVMLVASAMTLVISRGYLTNQARIFEYSILVQLSSVGMMVLISATDLITLYLGYELMSLALYVVAASHRDNLKSTEAGLKYFVLGALSSGMMLYGASLIYGFTGTVEFAGIATAAKTGSIGVIFGIVFLLVGLCFKISAVPFHMWTPDVYEGAPTPVTAFFASAPKVAAMAMAVRVAVEAMGPATEQWRQIVIFARLASIIFGAVAAIGQTNIKRLLAYSSINNVGFALVGLAAGTPQGVSAVLFYLTIYIVMTLGSFLVVLLMRDVNGEPVETIASLAGLSHSRRGLALAMMIFMLSLAGIPPLLGFNAKFAVFMAAVNAGLYPLAVVGFVASVIGTYYYLRVIKVMYFDDAAPEFARGDSLVKGGMMTAAAVFVSPVGWILLSPLTAWSMAAAKALF